MANQADNQLLHVMASMLPMSSSFVRQNRWEADVSNVIHTHLCKEDEDGHLIDDFDVVSELDAHDVATDGEDIEGKSLSGRSVRSAYEQADELIGGPLLPANSDGSIDWRTVRKRRRQHKRWQRRLRELNLSMSEGKPKQVKVDDPTTIQQEMVEVLSKVTENGHHAPVSARIRILSAYRMDRICTHARGVTVDIVTQCWVIDGRPIQE